MRTRLPAVLCACCLAASCYALPAPFAVQAKPSVPAYRIPDDLSGIRHLEKATDLSPAQRTMLAELGFVVVPDQAEQMFSLYEEYGQDEAKGPIPNFITVDSVLQAYHVFFDFSLRTVEREHLVRMATALTQLGASVSAQQVAQAPAGPLREAASRNLAYFLVARALLTDQAPGITADLPGKADIIQWANSELERIKAHEGRFPSAIMGRTVHYDQFVPRGHYTRSEDLKKYFRALMWYGLVGFEFDPSATDPALVDRHTLQALLITRFLAQNEWGRSLWDRIYEPTKFFVGAADDLTWEDYLPVAQGVFGASLELSALARPEALQQFRETARFPAPRIAPAFLEADEAGKLADTLNPPPQGRQFRFMGQRFIPDSWAIQQLVYPLVGANPAGVQRYWPMGLDVMASLGSLRARTLMIERYEQDKHESYLSQLDKVTQEFASTPEEDWWRNLYWGWLHSLRPLLGEAGDGYPPFMQRPEWLDKELMTAQGSWSQLRHDTILYGKPSGAEMGGPEEKLVQGYVELYPEVYARLAYLSHLSRTGLESRGLLPTRLAEAYAGFENMLLFLKTCSEKLLENRRLTSDEYARVQYFGGELERLTLDVVEGGENLTRWHEITNEADRYSSTIADIHTSFSDCLEVGVGLAQRLYVIVPHPGGGLQLCKGGIMSYYEFTWPVSDRLTDEKWIEMLKAGSQPAMPAWTQGFICP